jgi:hypothetical protein
VSTCGGHQNAIKGTAWHPFDPKKSWYEKTNEIGPLHTLDRTKMKQLGGAGMPQDVGYKFPEEQAPQDHQVGLG